MDGTKLLKAVQVAIALILPDAIAILREKPHGIIHKRAEAKMNGIRGFLVWDYIFWNEITFDDMDGNIISFFNSVSDKKTKAVWNQLVDEYGIKRGDVHVQEDAEEDTSGSGSLHSDRDGSDPGC